MMNIEKKAREIINQLTKYKQIQLVSDCLDIVENEKFYFEDNDLLPKEIAIENYIDKFIIQKNIIGEEKVIGYQSLINKLRSFNEDNVHLFTIAVSDSVFIIFFNEKNNILIGILRTFTQTKANLEKLNIEYKKKGLNVCGISMKFQ